MDSLTHIVLGAATGEIVLGKKVGNKAPVWGAIAGSLPDFDSFISPFLEPAKAVLFHRGPSHSILFALIAAPILAWVAKRLHKNGSIMQWIWLMLWAILIHSAIDCLNTYGTALLWPFSEVRLAFDSIGIIDLMLLVPITTLMVISLFKPKQSKVRKWLSSAILIYSLIFIVFSVGNKFFIEQKVKDQLKSKGIEYTRLKTAPLPLTNFLWLVLAEDSDGFHYGYISNFDKESISLKYVYRNSHLIESMQNDSKVQDLLFFTNGFYTIENKDDDSIWLHDLRFGSMAFHSDTDWYVFSFQIIEKDHSIEISRANPNRKFGWETFTDYWKRVF
jgi:inner membrane protein